MNKSLVTCDFLIIGAGIVGICVARQLKKNYPDSRIVVIEKEDAVGFHASGRNSGVLHAGFYYSKDSLKAKFTKEGNLALTQYCEDKKIPLNKCGKLVVTKNAEELVGLHELLNRGRNNNIRLELITEAEARKIEPRVKTYQEALFSPTTSSVNPKMVLAHLLEDVQLDGVQVHLNTRYLSNKNNKVQTSQLEYAAGYVINTAGLYADRIARDFGFSKDYRILPFKGLYLYGSLAEKFNTHIYPVPDLQHPFLGVHFTLTETNAVKIGPTAIPAFWREQYHQFSRFNFKEMLEIGLRELGLFFRAGFDFRKLAREEIKKYNRAFLVKQAALLAEGVVKENYTQWGKPGIRAQLINIRSRKLEMDFVIEGDNKSLHVLNAVSPAFTCSMPFAQYVVERIVK